MNLPLFAPESMNTTGWFSVALRYAENEAMTNLANKQLQDAYIVAANRTPIGKAPRGVFRNTRQDELLVHAIRSAVAQVPGLDTGVIEDAIVGCAIPEAEQGLNVARMGALLAGLPNTVGGRDRQPCLRVRPHGARDGRGPHSRRRSGRDDRGRLRIH